MRWVRADAARYLKPGLDAADAFPGIEHKYNPDQPRVPAGSSDGGQWTNADANAQSPQNSIAQPLGNIDFGDLPNFTELFGLFQITPREIDNTGYAQLAGDPPGIGHNGGPPLEPPEIPPALPSTSGERMAFARAVGTWLSGVGRFGPAASAFFEAADQVSDLNGLLAAGKSAADPPRTLEELQDRVGPVSEKGYQDHHIAEEAAARAAGFSESIIQGRDNLARVPVLKHIDITAEYATKAYQPDGTFRSLRDYLADKDFETRRSVGLAIMRKYGVLK
jgi:hypothetical protein